MADLEGGRRSDRWVTPGVVCTAIIVGGVLVLAVVGAVTWLTSHGQDPDPMLRLVANVTAAVGSVGTMLLQLTGRATAAKTERNTGVLASGVVQVVDELEARGRHAAQPPEPAPAPGPAWEEDVVPIPGRDTATRPHPLYGTPLPGRGAAPAAEGR